LEYCIDIVLKVLAPSLAAYVIYSFNLDMTPTQTKKRIFPPHHSNSAVLESFSFFSFYNINMKWLGGKLTPYVFMTAGLMLVLLSVQTFFTISNRDSRSARTNESTDPQASVQKNNAPVKACFVVLVRNAELGGFMSSMKQLEKTFNSKFNYPYVFLNDDDFTEEFKQQTSSLTNAETKYGKVDSQMWGYPSFINQTFAAERRKELALSNIPYASSESYRHMCR
jgi:alpha 1,2-mannosyltransferase